MWTQGSHFLSEKLWEAVAPSQTSECFGQSRVFKASCGESLQRQPGKGEGRWQMVHAGGWKSGNGFKSEVK